MRRLWSRSGSIVLFSLLALLGIVSLEHFPGLTTDEGWTLCVARTWVEHGHYGCLLDGRPASSTWAAHPPVIAPIALSFYLFGVGIWQGRIVTVIFTIGALWLLWLLTEKLFDRRHAWGALAVALLLPLRWQLHPWLLGRQVFGEMPMLFYLLSGYALCLLALRRSWLFILLADVFWGIALMSKQQVFPFWTASLVIALVFTVTQQRWRSTILLTVGLLGSSGVFHLLQAGKRIVLPGYMPAAAGELVQLLALVFVPSVRLLALAITLTLGLSAVIGLAYAVWKGVRTQLKNLVASPEDLVRLMLLVLAGSWLAWYTLLSIGWERYAAPALFLASPFVAALFHDLTDGFRLAETCRLALSALAQRRFSFREKQASAALLLALVIGGASVVSLSYKFFNQYDASASHVADFINTTTPLASRIETSDPPLFFLLDRSYHYPPARVRVASVGRRFLGRSVSAPYDPLATDPDYLVIGPNSSRAPHYQAIVATPAFRLLRSIGSYTIYERVRSREGQ